MKKMVIRISICFFISILCWGLFLLRDRYALREEIIRFHVVANSDTPEDQSVKLAVRDAVLASMESDMKKIQSKEEAVHYLEKAIPKLQSVANSVLQRAGVEETAVVSFCREAFPIREYDTFSLPSGIYDTLRIVIGEGEGKNWWCVTFPTLCLSATAEGFQSAAAGAGFSGSLTDTLVKKETSSIRFYLLDSLGKLENSLFGNIRCPIS